MSQSANGESKKIAFIHPDLGIGGAERLVVDAAVGLQDLDNSITIYTSHCDKSHCFEEVSSGKLKVEVYGDFLPTSVLGRFHILFAFLRQLYLVLRLIICGEINQYDYFIVDQLSYCIPLLSIFSDTNCKILFYCHFPDQLLVKQDGGKLKKLYRLPFNYIEETTTGASDKIVVNSKFTKSMFHKTFSSLTHVEPGVIYPCVDTQVETDEETDEEVKNFFGGSPFFLSVNRFEMKKNVELAINSFAKFKKLVPSTKVKPRLVVAGGYDSRVSENVLYLSELTKLCDSLKLTSFTIRGKLIIMPPSTDVLFLPSIRSSLKVSLLKQAELLLYTPSFEHFGIVPVESMLNNTPVLGVNNGGPLESIVNFDGTNLDKATGFTEEPDHEKWSKIMVKYADFSEDKKCRLGENGTRRALEMFSREQMARDFMTNLESTIRKKRSIPHIVAEYWRFEVLLVVLAMVLYRYVV
jgi:alpha-1,3/alpha-1,6-mannosyltransferase